MIAMVLKPMRIDDGTERKIVPPGTTIEVEDKENISPLIKQGYLRLVTEENTKQTLDEYVEYAKKVFEKQLKPCHACKEKKYWLSKYGKIICGVCHPPANDSLVERWL